MSDAFPESQVDSAPGNGRTAGTMLREAREAGGWSIDAVAQQLKLAPRQVHALEQDRPDELPGRTFVRGFARNYARLLNLDPDAVVAAIPGLADVGSGAAVPLSASSRSIGEMPSSSAPRAGSFARWAIPLVLIALIALAAGYEFLRPGNLSPSPAPAAPATQAPQARGDPAVALPNPLGGPADAPVPASTPAEAVAAPGVPATQQSAGTITAAPAGVAPVVAPAPATVDAAPAVTLVIRYRGSAWTEVRDANGQRLLLHTGAPGTEQVVEAKGPVDITLGNANQVSLTWRGQPFDLAPHIRQNNIARARLP